MSTTVDQQAIPAAGKAKRSGRTKPTHPDVVPFTKAYMKAPSIIRRRLRRGIAVLLASSDGRYLEQLDAHLSALEKAADEIRKDR